MICNLFAVLFYACLLTLSKQDFISCDIVKEYGRRGLNNHVKCQGKFLEANVLKDAVGNIAPPIDIFEIYNSSFELLPEDIFSENKNAKVRKFILSHSSLSLLATREYNIPPLHSVEDSLESIEVYDSNLVFAWNFSALSALTALQTIIFENSEFITVPDTFKLWPSLRFVQLINCNIKWVHEKAFQENTDMRICSLSHNLIEKISRSMFPKRNSRLWSLDLSFNKLEVLPKNMFRDMDYLKELKLDYNRFKVAGEHFKLVWNDLTHLWLNGNEMVCWSWCNIFNSRKQKKERPQFFDSATCEKPPKEIILIGSFFC